jgi:GrpB-like predicted nucleotidyltransferase (UPF0157 family)
MLTESQQKYLLTIPEEKIVFIQPYDPSILDIVEEITQQIKNCDPNLTVLFMGASALGISGQGDIDLYVLSPTEQFEEHTERFVKSFGKPVLKGTCVKWVFSKNGHKAELYITDPEDKGLQEQIKVFELLKNNKELLKEYEEIKQQANGLSFKEYQRRKYEFYNRILFE